MDGKIIQMSLPSLDTEEDEEEEFKTETEERRDSMPTRNTSLEQMDERFDFTPPTPIGQWADQSLSPEPLTKITRHSTMQ